MKRSVFEIEICAGNIQSVIEADKGGANRVELCENLFEGGTTPSIGTVLLAKEKTNLEVFPIIRPRGGDFVFSDIEFEVMLQDIKSASSIGADGFALGCLKSDSTIDYEMCARLIDAAKGLPITFHRAFDLTPDPFEAMKTLRALGIKRILTSGQKNKAVDGISLLKQLNNQADESIIIMPGSGIDEANIQLIAMETNAKAFHASLRNEIQSKTITHPEVRFMGSNQLAENKHKMTSSERVKAIIKKLEEL